MEGNARIKKSRDSVIVTLHEGGLVRIETVRYRRDVNVGGFLWVGVEALPWLIDAVVKCVETLVSSETDIGAASLRVKEKGHEFDPKVGIGNVRTGSVERAGRYFIVMREYVVPEFVEQLSGLGE
jgi:hypothetical protein